MVVARNRLVHYLSYEQVLEESLNWLKLKSVSEVIKQIYNLLERIYGTH